MQNADFSDLTFLIAEDSAYMRSIIRTLLQGFGIRNTHEAEDGAAALEVITEYQPDIVLLDHELPILDGSEVMRLIRQPTNPLAYTPVIMITAHTSRKRVVELMDLGINELLCKPVSARGLYMRICSVVFSSRKFIKSETYFGPEPRTALRRTANALQPASVVEDRAMSDVVQL